MGRKKRKGGDAEAGPRFTPDMLVIDALEADERVEKILLSYGLPCHRCIVAESETLAQGCAPLDVPLDELLEKLNGLGAG